jgi:fructokinase
MIAVIGEALIDLVARPDGSLLPRPGGAAFNTARTLGRLEYPVTYVGRLADDGFGVLLRDSLSRDGVRLGLPAPAGEPTSLALVDLDDAGSPRFRFYLTGTSVPGLTSIALPADITVVHAGSLALAVDPIASAIEALVLRDLPPGVLVMIDPNCRPSAIVDASAYRKRMFRILRRADIVKVSTEDLAYLFPGEPVPSAVAALRPALVLVSDGPRSARALLPSGEPVAVDVPIVEVADTIGAGDAFGGAFLGSFTGAGFGRSDLSSAEPVRAALEVAVEVAALTCTRVGAEPPRRSELTRPLGQSPR